MSCESGVAPVEQFAQEIEDIAATILTQTAGLLEIHDSVSTSGKVRNDFAILPRYQESASGMMPPHSLLDICYNIHHSISVSFVHRSAADFLSENSEAQHLLSEASFHDTDVETVRLEADHNVSRVFMLAVKHFHMGSHTEIPRSAEQSVVSLVDINLSAMRKKLREVDPNTRAHPRKLTLEDFERYWTEDARLLLHCCAYGSDRSDVLKRIRGNSVIGHFSFLGIIADEHLMVNDFLYSGHEKEWRWILRKLSYEHAPSSATLLQSLLSTLTRGSSQLNPYKETRHTREPKIEPDEHKWSAGQTDSEDAEDEDLRIANCPSLKVCLHLVSKLLSIGLDPNHQCEWIIKHRLFPRIKKDDLSLWELFLHCTMIHPHEIRSPGHKHQYLGLLSQFLDVGANVHAQVPHTERCRWILYTSVSVLFVLRMCFQDDRDAKVLMDRMTDCGATINYTLEWFGKPSTEVRWSSHKVEAPKRSLDIEITSAFERYMNNKYVRNANLPTGTPQVSNQRDLPDFQSISDQDHPTMEALMMDILDRAVADDSRSGVVFRRQGASQKALLAD